jgi:nucleotide-binding universal stress UspA family protein
MAGAVVLVLKEQGGTAMDDLNIKRILIPTDCSEASRIELDYGLLFADTFGAELVLFYADPIAFPADLMTGAPVYVAAPSIEDLSLLEREVRAYADKSLQGKSYQVVVAGGQPIPTILQHANESQADLIVMATHGLRGWRRTVLGSVTEGVLHGARCPVLSVSRSDRPGARAAGVTRIVCPVNFTNVARDSLRVATQLARAFSCEVVIVHVLEAEEAADEKRDEQRIRQWIAPDVQSNCTYREIVLRGGASERILDCVEDIGADFLVIGAQHKFFRDTTVIGTTTERLVRFARIPVLTVVREAAAAAKAA